MRRVLLDRLLEARAQGTIAALVTDLESGAQLLLAGEETFGDLTLPQEERAGVERAMAQDRSLRLSDGRLFIQVFTPPLRLVVVGAVHIAQALVPLARIAGYAVFVIDPRRAWATERRFPDVTLIDRWPEEALAELKPDRRTAIVTLTHDPKLDDPALVEALRSDAFYVGALGSKRTHAKRLERLRTEGLTEEALARIHGPAGLAIGALSPAEIAIAVLAEMTAVLREARSRRAPQAEAAAS